jgi:hypothetical protein
LLLAEVRSPDLRIRPSHHHRAILNGVVAKLEAGVIFGRCAGLDLDRRHGPAFAPIISVTAAPI